MEIVLYQPEIPPNTGNIARLSAAFGLQLNLIKPLGFSLDDRYLKRAGLDYWPYVQLQVWSDFSSWRAASQSERLILCSARQGENLGNFAFKPQDALVFGRETSGLPPEIFALSPFRVRIPIRHVVRSLNLSTAVGIITYQAMLSAGLNTEEMP